MTVPLEAVADAISKQRNMAFDELAKAQVFIDQLTAERDQLTAEVERLRGAPVVRGQVG